MKYQCGGLAGRECFWKGVDEIRAKYGADITMLFLVRIKGGEIEETSCRMYSPRDGVAVDSATVETAVEELEGDLGALA